MRRELESRQTQLLAVMDEVDRFLAARGAMPVTTIGELRVVAEQILADHYRFKEAVFVRLRERGAVHVDRQVARSRSALLALQVAHRFHLADWPADAIARNWLGYAVATQGLTARIRTMVANDRAQLYPLIDEVLGGGRAARGGEVEDPSAQALATALGRLGHTPAAA